MPSCVKEMERAETKLNSCIRLARECTAHIRDYRRAGVSPATFETIRNECMQDARYWHRKAQRIAGMN